MILQVSEVDMRDQAGVLETAVDNAVDHGSQAGLCQDAARATACGRGA